MAGAGVIQVTLAELLRHRKLINERNREEQKMAEHEVNVKGAGRNRFWSVPIYFNYTHKSILTLPTV